MCVEENGLASPRQNRVQMLNRIRQVIENSDMMKNIPSRRDEGGRVSFDVPEQDFRGFLIDPESGEGLKNILHPAIYPGDLGAKQQAANGMNALEATNLENMS